MATYRRDANLQDILVHGKRRKMFEKIGKPGTQKYGKSCAICKHMHETNSNKVKEANNMVFLDRIDCKTRNTPVLVPHSFVLVEAFWRDSVQFLNPEGLPDFSLVDIHTLTNTCIMKHVSLKYMTFMLKYLFHTHEAPHPFVSFHIHSGHN